MKKTFLILFLSTLGFAAPSTGVHTSTGTVKKVAPNKKPAPQVHVSTRTATTTPSKPRVDPEIVKRRREVQDAATKMSPAQAPLLIQALSDKDAIVRELAARGLGDLRWAAAASSLGGLLITDPQSHVREACAISLKQIGGEASTLFLIKGTKDTQEEVRIASVDGLSMATSTVAVQAVEAALQDSAVNVRRTAVIILPRMGHVNSLELLTTAAVQDSDVYVRANAIDGLIILARRQPLPVYKTALKDREPLVQANAARALAHAGDFSGLKGIEPLSHSSDRIVRLAAIDALGYSKESSVQTLLKGLSNDPDPGIQQAVQTALERMDRRKNEKK